MSSIDYDLIQSLSSQGLTSTRALTEALLSGAHNSVSTIYKLSLKGLYESKERHFTSFDVNKIPEEYLRIYYFKNEINLLEAEQLKLRLKHLEAVLFSKETEQNNQLSMATNQSVRPAHPNYTTASNTINSIESQKPHNRDSFIKIENREGPVRASLPSTTPQTQPPQQISTTAFQIEAPTNSPQIKKPKTQTQAQVQTQLQSDQALGPQTSVPGNLSIIPFSQRSPDRFSNKPSPRGLNCQNCQGPSLMHVSSAEEYDLAGIGRSRGNSPTFGGRRCGEIGNRENGLLSMPSTTRGRGANFRQGLDQRNLSRESQRSNNQDSNERPISLKKDPKTKQTTHPPLAALFSLLCSPRVKAKKREREIGSLSHQATTREKGLDEDKPAVGVRQSFGSPTRYSQHFKNKKSVDDGWAKDSGLLSKKIVKRSRNNIVIKNEAPTNINIVVNNITRRFPELLHSKSAIKHEPMAKVMVTKGSEKVFTSVPTSPHTETSYLNRAYGSQSKSKTKINNFSSTLDPSIKLPTKSRLLEGLGESQTNQEFKGPLALDFLSPFSPKRAMEALQDALHRYNIVYMLRDLRTIRCQGGITLHMEVFGELVTFTRKLVKDHDPVILEIVEKALLESLAEE